MKNALEKDNNSEQIKQLLSSLSGSLVAYDAAQNPADKDKEKERLQALIPFIAEMEATIVKWRVLKRQKVNIKFS